MEELGTIHTKKCGRCKKILPHSDFYAHNLASGVTKLQGSCKRCESSRTTTRGKLREAEWEARGKSCERCGLEDVHSFFDFHHIDPALKEIQINKVWYYGKERRDEELAKCIMVCPNCHRKLHVELGNFGLSNKHKKLAEEVDYLDKARHKTTE